MMLSSVRRAVEIYQVFSWYNKKQHARIQKRIETKRQQTRCVLNDARFSTVRAVLPAGGVDSTATSCFQLITLKTATKW